MRILFVHGHGRKVLEDFKRIEDEILDLAKRLGLEIGIVYTPRSLNEVDAINDLKPFGFAFADNGAYQFLTGSWEHSLILRKDRVERWFNTFAEFLERLDYDEYALPDLPVHGKEFAPREERLNRIAESARLHAGFLDRYGLPNWVPVLQGYEIDEYELSYQLLKDFGIESNFYAVGSVCSRKKTKTLIPFVQQFLDSCCEQVRRFHFFGLNFRAAKPFRRHPRLYSIDTGAWAHALRWRWRDIAKSLGYSDEEIKRMKYNRAEKLKAVLKHILLSFSDTHSKLTSSPC